jgi:hypothetical protein
VKGHRIATTFLDALKRFRPAEHFISFKLQPGQRCKVALLPQPLAEKTHKLLAFPASAMQPAAGMVSAAEESACSQQTAKEQSQVAQIFQEVMHLPHGAVFMASMAVHDRDTCPAVCAIGWSGKRQECAGSSAYTSTRSVVTAAVHISSMGHLAQPLPRSLGSQVIARYALA